MGIPTRRRILLGATAGGLLVTAFGPAQAATAGPGRAAANGATIGSGGVLSGNLVEVPVNLPISLCGNALSLLGLGDGASGDRCAGRGATPAPPSPRPCGCARPHDESFYPGEPAVWRP